MEHSRLSQKTAVFNLLVFRLQKTGGITRLWRMLLQEFKNSQESSAHIAIDHDGIADSLGISKLRFDLLALLTRGWFVYARVNDVVVHTYNAVTVGTGHSIVVCHDLMIEKTVWHRNIVKKFLWRASYSTASKVICVSEKTRAEFCTAYPGLARRSVVIENPNDPKFKFQRVRQKRSSCFAMLYIGQRVGAKNFIKYRQFRSRFKLGRIKLYVIGPVPDAAELQFWSEEVDADALRFLGPVSDTEYMAVASSVDALFFPSTDEGFGFPQVEAVAMGIPVLYENASIVEIIPGEMKFKVDDLIDVDDLDRVASIETEVREQCSRCVVDRFSLASCATSYLRSIRNL